MVGFLYSPPTTPRPAQTHSSYTTYSGTLTPLDRQPEALNR
jgi:hypothetical protein